MRDLEPPTWEEKIRFGSAHAIKGTGRMWMELVLTQHLESVETNSSVKFYIRIINHLVGCLTSAKIS